MDKHPDRQTDLTDWLTDWLHFYPSDHVEKRSLKTNRKKKVAWDTKVKCEGVSGEQLHPCPDHSFPAAAAAAEAAGQKRNNSPEKTQTWRIHR